MAKAAPRPEIEVERLVRLDAETLEALVVFGREALGEAALDEWLLPVVATCGLLCVARLGEEIVGAAAIIRCLENQELYMDNFYIRLEYQRRGLGRRLLAEVSDLATASGFERLLVTLDPDNEPGQRFYGGAGFRQVDYLPDYYGSGRHRLLLALDLEGGRM